MPSPQTIFITGANTGLGYETVKALHASSTPYIILLGSRELSNAASAITTLNHATPQSASTLHPIKIDVTSDTSIAHALEHITAVFGNLDCLINNAGASFDLACQQGQLTARQAFNSAWDVNVTSAHCVTTAFVPLLLNSPDPRLLFITSGTSALAETEKFDYPPLARLNASPAAGWPKPPAVNPVVSYRSSKTGLNMLMREWTKTLKEDGVKVWGISPGFLATGLAGVGAEKLRELGARDPAEGGRFVRDVVEGKRDGDQGKVIRATMVQPW